MLRGLKQEKYHKFDYYLRQCNKCGEIFKASTKKSKFCVMCKIEINKNKTRNSLIARGVYVEVCVGDKEKQLVECVGVAVEKIMKKVNKKRRIK